MTRHQWWTVLRRCLRDVRADGLTDRAAALTYYGLLSIFPGVLVLVSVLGVLGGPASGLNDLIGSVAPGQAGEFIRGVVDQVSSTGATAGFVAVVSLLLAFWSASAYMAAFVRSLAAVHGSTGGGVKRNLPLRLGLTAAVGLLLVICVFIVVFTGGLARRVGEAVGLGSVAVTAWEIAKWPVLLILVAVLFALLYRAAPGHQGGRRWITIGSLAAVLLWIVVSALFGVYLATFASYQRTYGALSGVIVFLVWLWLSNLVVLLGAELDAELAQARREAPANPA